LQSAESLDKSTLAQLKSEQDSLIKSLKENNHTFTVIIPRFAQIIEKRGELNDPSLTEEGLDFLHVSQISTIITRFFRRMGLDIWPWVSEYLPPKYKDPTKIHNKGTDERSALPSELDQLISFNEREVAEQIAHVPTSEMDPLYVKMKKWCAEVESQATKRKVLLSGHEPREDFRTKKPKERITVLWEAYHWLRMGPLLEMENFVKKYPPPAEMEAKWAIGVEEHGMLYYSIVNLKFSLTVSQWITRIKYMIHQSKHGAAVFDLVETMICDNCWDDKLGREKDDCNAEMLWDFTSPSRWRCGTCGGTTGKKRGLTREQCGDNKAPILTLAEELVNNLPGFYEMLDFYMSDAMKRIYSRKIRLGPDLSRKA